MEFYPLRFTLRRGFSSCMLKSDIVIVLILNYFPNKTDRVCVLITIVTYCSSIVCRFFGMCVFYHHVLHYSTTKFYHCHIRGCVLLPSQFIVRDSRLLSSLRVLRIYYRCNIYCPTTPFVVVVVHVYLSMSYTCDL